MFIAVETECDALVEDVSDLFGQLLCGLSCFLHFPSFEMKNGKNSIAL